MKLTVRLGVAEREETQGGDRITAVDGDLQLPVAFASRLGWTTYFNLAAQCDVDLNPDEMFSHTLSASMRDTSGNFLGAEATKVFEPPDYRVFPFMFWWPEAKLFPGAYYVCVSLDETQSVVRPFFVVPHEMNPRRAR